MGAAAQQLLTQGVEFSGVTLAVTAPEGDSAPELIETVVGNMRDVSRYCSILAMEEDAARAALEAGAVTAVLQLPEDFVQGVMYGRNPDLTLLVSGQQPLESLLLLWVGQSAADLLSTVQTVIYAVLEEYALSPPQGLGYDDVVMQINLRFINWTLNRQSLFTLDTVTATGQLPILQHYALSLLGYLGFALAPLFSYVYDRRQLAFRRRLRSLGWGNTVGWCSDLLSCFLLALPLSLGALTAVLGLRWQVLLLGAVIAALWALWGSLCCLATVGSASCGGLSFGAGLLWLTVAGGILPPALLPASVRAVSWLSPVQWVRSLAAVGLERALPAREGIAMAAFALGVLLLSWLLYRCRLDRQEVAL